MLALPPGERDDKDAERAASRRRQAARRARRAAARHRAEVPELRRSGRGQAVVGRGRACGAQAGRGVPVVLFRPALDLRLGGAQDRAGGLRHRAGQREAVRREGRRSCATALDPQAHSISEIPPFDLNAGAPALHAAAQAGGGRLEGRQGPDRGDQRRARRCCRSACCRSSRRARSPTAICCSRAIARWPGSRAPMR